MLIPFGQLRVVVVLIGAALVALFFGQLSKAAETGVEGPSPAVKPYFFHNGAAWSPLVWGAPEGGMFHQRQFASPTVHRFWFGAPYLQTMVAPPASSHLARTMKLKENQFYFRYHVPPGYERWGWTEGVGYAPKEPGLSYGPNVYPEKQAVIVGTPYQTQYSGEATGSYQKLLHFDRLPGSSQRDVEAAEKYVALGDEQFAKGEFQHALRRYRQASEAAPDFAVAHFRQAFAYVASNRSDFAARALRKGLGLEPTWNESRFDLAALCGDSAARFDEHTATMRTRAEARTADSDTYFTLGVLHFLKNDDQSAKAYFDAVYHIGGKNAEFLNGFPAGTRGRNEAGQAGG